MAKLSFEEYQELASRTASKHDYEIINYAMGLTGEIGELVDIFKKILFHSHPMDVLNIKKEGGDVLWYSGQLMRLLNVKFDAFEGHQQNEYIISRLKEQDNLKNLLMVACLQLPKAAGDIADYVDRMSDEKKIVNKKKMKNLFLRVFINLHFLLTYSGLTLEETAEGNIKKLEERYPEGFSVERSINREEL